MGDYEDEATQEQNYRLYRVHKTVSQMLADRGYLVSQESLNMQYADFIEKFGDPSTKEVERNALTLIAPRKDDPSDSIFVFFPEDPKVGVKPIRGYCERMASEKPAVYRAIIVVQESMTAFAKQALAEMGTSYTMEVFNESELQVNITEHVLVPKHTLLTPDEQQALLQKYKVKETQLPRMQVNDPVARYYGLKRGDVVKIIRPSETAGRYVRGVVATSWS